MKISYKLDDKEIELLKEIEDITGVDYEIENNLIPAENFMIIIKDLKCKIGILEEKIENYEENYRPLTNKELYSYYEE